MRVSQLKEDSRSPLTRSTLPSLTGTSRWQVLSATSSKASLRLASIVTCVTPRRLLLSLKIPTTMERRMEAKVIKYAQMPTPSFAAVTSTFTTAPAGTRYAVIPNLSAARTDRIATATLLTPQSLSTRAVMAATTRHSTGTTVVRMRHTSLR